VNDTVAATLVGIDERDWNPSSKTGWFSMVEASPRPRPPSCTAEQLCSVAARERVAYDHARAVWHANIGPIRTPQMDALFEALDEITGANRQDGDKVKPTAVLDALPGLGKTTAALAFGQAFHRAQIDHYGPELPVPGGSWQRIPVVCVGLTSNTTMRSLNAMLCRFFGLPGADRGNADWLASRAAECVASYKTRLIILGDVHFLDVNRRDGREVADHFKWLAKHLPGHVLVRRGGFGGSGTARRGALGSRRGVLPDPPPLERVQPGPVRDRHQGRAGHLASAAVGYRTRAGAGQRSSRPGRLTCPTICSLVPVGISPP
jgi:hypothetical protein